MSGRSAGAEEWLAAAHAALAQGKPRHALRALDRAETIGALDGRFALVRARALAAVGEASAAVPHLERAGRDASIAIAAEAARMLVELGEVARGVTLADALSPRAPDHEGILETLFSAARIGWTFEAITGIEGLLPASRGLEVPLAAARLFDSLRDDARARAAAELALARDPASFEAAAIRARILARGATHRSALALEAADRASTLAGSDAARLAESAMLHLAAGDLDGAARDHEAVLRSTSADDALRATARAWLAELALWRGDLDLAEREASTVLATDPAHARALAVRGGVEVLRGALEPALATLDAAVAADAELFEALHFRGEALRRLGRHKDARADFDLAIALHGGHSFTARANRLLGVIEERPELGDAPYAADTYLELLDALTPLAGPPSSEAKAGLARGLRPHLARAIDALGGNRSTTPTRHEDGRAVPIPLRLDARAAARAQQERMRFEPVERVLAGFAPLVAAHGDWPTIHCHEGETLLWIGRYEEAIACFERALSLFERTRWGWIGLMASRLMAGDLDGAERANEHAMRDPPPGRTLFVYRGELHLARGRLDLAEADLERARVMNPERLACPLLLARLAVARGDAARARGEIDAARTAAPAFFFDVERAGASARDPDALARTALTMMRGNRTAGLVSYFTHDGRLRFVPPPPIRAVRLE